MILISLKYMQLEFQRWSQKKNEEIMAKIVFNLITTINQRSRKLSKFQRRKEMNKTMSSDSINQLLK